MPAVGWLLVALLAAAVIAWVSWHHGKAARARAGVELAFPLPDVAIARAIHEAYCGPVRGRARAMVSGVTVVRVGQRSFRSRSEAGDEGAIEVLPAGRTTLVRAYATVLAPGRTAVHRLFDMAPGAARMVRFHGDIEGRVRSRLPGPGAGARA